MILASILALSLAASDSTVAVAPVPESPSFDSSLVAPTVDNATATPPGDPSPVLRGSLQKPQGHSSSGNATVPLTLLGLVVGTTLSGPVVMALADGGDACGWGCMGSPSTMLLALGGGMGVLVGLPYLGYKIGRSIDAQAIVGPDRVGLLLTSELRFPWIPSPGASAALR